MDFTFSSEQVQLRRKARDFIEREIGPIADELDATYDYHLEGVDRIKKSGFYAYMVPEAYGGKGISSINLCIVREIRRRVYTARVEAEPSSMAVGIYRTTAREMGGETESDMLKGSVIRAQERRGKPTPAR